MSNHMIGQAMSPVLVKIMEMRLNNELQDKAAEILIKEILQAVRWEDGREYEATQDIDRMFCGHCGKRIPVSQPIYDADETVFRFRNTINYEHFHNYARYSKFFCVDCFREFLSTNPEKIDVDQEIARQHEERWVNYSKEMDS